MLAPSVQHLPGLSMELVELWAMLCLLWSGRPVWHKVEMTMSKKKKEKKIQTLSQGGFSAVEGSVWDQARQREPAPITLVPLVSGHLLCL